MSHIQKSGMHYMSAYFSRLKLKSKNSTGFMIRIILHHLSVQLIPRAKLFAHLNKIANNFQTLGCSLQPSSCKLQKPAPATFCGLPNENLNREDHFSWHHKLMRMRLNIWVFTRLAYVWITPTSQSALHSVFSLCGNVLNSLWATVGTNLMEITSLWAATGRR